MTLTLSSVKITVGNLSLYADATFSEGIHIISGRMGSGKSTLAQTICGLIPGYTGKISYDESYNSPKLLMQYPEYQVTGKTILEEIKSWNVNYLNPIFNQLDVLTQDLNRDPLTLSSGELRRLELACILSTKSEILILDEPYSHLDQSIIPILNRLLEDLKGIVIIFTKDQDNIKITNPKYWKLSDGVLTSA